MKISTIVGHCGGECKGEWGEQRGWDQAAPTSRQVKARLRAAFEDLLGYVDVKGDTRQFDEVERGARERLFALGRLALAWFLALRHERSGSITEEAVRQGGRRREKLERKLIQTFFGRVCFWRTYVRFPGGSGFHPLDIALGLTADAFSLWTTEVVARLATLLSFDQVTGMMLYFASWSPSKTSVEKAVLGLGYHTQEWFESAPAPDGDGEILVIQFDSKAVPTATEQELEKRRGKREKRKPPLSPRHRGRQKRDRQGPKKRREPGDRSKNGKAATIFVMYTLKVARDEKGKKVLLGPINKRIYASYAPKRHAFAVARREADKRGFRKGSGKTTQIVIDGDVDLESYAKDFFPDAKYTLDVMHVLEYVWEAGRLLFEHDKHGLQRWVKRQERLLYAGRAVLVVEHVWEARKDVRPEAHERLREIRDYLAKRLSMMNYHELRKQDLEVASGAVEGAVRHVIGKRFDHGSMRWITTRAEPLLQLRCIELNGDWDAFIRFVHRRVLEHSRRQSCPVRILRTDPAPLPTIGVGHCSAAA